MTDSPVDDDELLAPDAYPADEAEEREADELVGEWQFSHGFPDSKRVVRVWVDEETRHLTKVRISPRWREILGSRSLDDAFGEAFFLANAHISDDSAPWEAQPDPEVEPSHATDLSHLDEQLKQLLERADELNSRAPEDVRWADLTGERAVGTAVGGAVTVTLSLTGLTESVRFDRTWLQTASMSEVTGAIQRAHQQAYARHTPPTFVPGEHEELARDIAQTRTALMTILSKGIQ